MKKKITAILVLCLLYANAMFGDNVGLLIMATGKYIQFVMPLIESAERYFCVNHNVTYYVFTDGDLPPADNIVCIYQKRIGWPYDSMMRGHVYAAHGKILKKQDYLFACDADMLFVDYVGDEILGKRVATQHPGFVGKRGSYETNSLSTACVYDNEGEYYFAGGFYGGTADEFLKIVRMNAKNINKDVTNNIIAVWHDESHWNRYCIDHKPTIILSPSYCYPESWDIPYKKRLLALDKNHSELRKDN